MDLFTKQEFDAIESVKDHLRAAEEDMERADRHKFEVWGAKLKQIRDNKWYIAFEPGCTWENYTKERWKMSFQRAAQLIDAYDIALQISTLVEESSTNVELPLREAHVRPLKALEKTEQRAEVWQRTITRANGNPITAALVEAEVQRYRAELEKNWITLEEWDALTEAEQTFQLSQVRYISKTMNQPNDNIEWAMWSWNPITGCLHGCDYCYARDIANRFYPQKFVPSFVPDRLPAPKNTSVPKPRWNGDFGYNGVFVCSMADLFGKWVPEVWITSVLRAIRDNPQWKFLLLTKFPIRMADFEYPPNVWLGTTVDYQWRVERAEKAFRKIKASGFDGICWLSCEPMMERLTFDSLEMFDWVVMGGASKSTQTPEHRPPPRDIIHLTNQADVLELPVYWKKNLWPGISDEQRLREYPEAQS